MTPLQQAFVLTTTVLVLGVAMIVGAVALRPQTPIQIVIAPPSMPSEDMGVSGNGYEPDGKAAVAPGFSFDCELA